MTRNTFIKSFSGFIVGAPIVVPPLLRLRKFRHLCAFDYKHTVEGHSRKHKDRLRDELQKETGMVIRFDEDTESGRETRADCLKDCDLLIFYNQNPTHRTVSHLEDSLRWYKENYPEIKKTMKVLAYDKNFKYNIIGDKNGRSRPEIREGYSRS